MRYVNSRATVSCSVRWNSTVIFYSHYLFVHQNEKKSSCNNLYYLIVSKRYKVLPVLWQLLLERYCFNKSSLANLLRATLKTDSLTYWKWKYMKELSFSSANRSHNKVNRRGTIHFQLDLFQTTTWSLLFGGHSCVRFAVELQLKPFEALTFFYWAR